MTYADLARSMEFYARRHGVKLDAVDALAAVHLSLIDFASRWDFDCFTVHRLLAVTTPGLDHYTLPEDFGRFLHPFDRGRTTNEAGSGETGVSLWDGETEQPLSYERPANFFEVLATDEGRPSRFTRVERVIYLDPPPDDNDNDQYEIRGTYIVHPSFPEPHESVIIHAPMALMVDALQRAGVPVDAAERRMALSNMVNHQARLRQRFGVM